MSDIKTSAEPTENRYMWLTAACILAIVVIIGNLALIRGKAAPIWDATDYYGPMFSLVADYAKSWKLLLWNPWINAGSPDFADPQSGATSPILLLFGFLSSDPFKGFIIYWISAWIFGGFGMLILCRHLKCPAWGGLIASLGFVCSGFYTAHGEHTSIIYSISFLPWIVWRFDIALARRSYWSMVQTGVLWGMSALGGYPAIVILDPIFLTFWALGRTCFVRDEFGSGLSKTLRQRLLFSVAGLCLMGVIGAAVMSPCYIGFLEYTKGYTLRADGLSRQRVNEGPLPSQALLTVASPYLYLLNFERIWQPDSDISGSNIYMGALVLSLAVVALFSRSRWRRWLGVIILFFMSCALGSRLPIRGWMYDLVLPTRYFRGPTLFSAYGIFVFCILAALATSDLDESRVAGTIDGRRRFFLLCGSIALAAGFSYVFLLRAAHLSIDSAGRPSRVLITVWLSLVVTAFLWWQRKITGRLFVTALVIIAVYDAGSTLEISAPTISSSASLPWWTAMRSRHVRNLDLTYNGFTRRLFPPDDVGSFYQHDRNLPAKEPVFANDTGMVNQFFQPYVGDPVLNRLAIGSERIWFSDRPIWLPANEAAFAAYTDVSHALGVPPLVLHSTYDVMHHSDAQPNLKASNADRASAAEMLSPTKVELITYFPNTLKFRYRTNQDGWLLITDRWATGWKATVNGHPVEIAAANFLFRAIPVSHGENTVVFHYAPRGYLGLVSLSWGTLVFVMVCEVVRHTRRRKSIPQSDSFATQVQIS